MKSYLKLVLSVSLPFITGSANASIAGSCSPGAAFKACMEAQAARNRSTPQARLQQQQYEEAVRLRRQRAQERVDEYNRQQRAIQQQNNDYFRRQQQQQQQQTQARDNMIANQIRSSNAVSVSSYAGWNQRPEYRISNNTDANLRVHISYVLKGANGAYYTGTESTTIGPRREQTGVFFTGPVDTQKQWNINIPNTRWEKAY